MIKCTKPNSMAIPTSKPAPISLTRYSDGTQRSLIRGFLSSKIIRNDFTAPIPNHALPSDQMTLITILIVA